MPAPSPSTHEVATATRPAGTGRGIGAVLIAVYGILALAAAGRSSYQIIDRFDQAPVAYTLSALSAAVYIVATIALVARGRTWYRVAVITIAFELVGVLVVGTLSLVAPGVLGTGSGSPFGENATVWSLYGAGYVFIPLVLPVLGLLWLRRRHPGTGPL